MDFLKLYQSAKTQIKEAILNMWKESAPELSEQYFKQLDSIIDTCVSDNIVVENMAHWTGSTDDKWKDIVNPLIWRRKNKQDERIIEPIPYRPYKHQFESWKTLLDDNWKSIVVTSGTGSGKTECFMVPLIHALTKDSGSERKQAVEAIFLYPLNALMEDQKERLDNYISFSEKKLNFAVYNGNTPETANSPTFNEDDLFENEIGTRDDIRTQKPNILLTNPSMLEYMLLRHQDKELFSNELKWIVIDETHTFKGSAGAELAMLIRRILKACGRTPDQVRFATSSATIGDSEDAAVALKQFISDITGQETDKIEIIRGFRSEPSTSDLSIKSKLAENDFILLKDLIKDGTIEEKLEKLNSICNDGLRVRLHYYLQALNHGLYVNLEDVTDGMFDLWTYMPLDGGKLCQHFLEANYCTECGSLLGYGEMDSNGTYTHIIKTASSLEDFADEDVSDDDNTDDETTKELQTKNFYIALKTGEDVGTSYLLNDEGKLIANADGRYVVKFVEQKFNKKSKEVQNIHHCPCCGAHGIANRKPMRSFHMSSDYLSRLIAPILLKQTTPSEDSESDLLPSKGCKYISFADSRQSVAGPTIKQNLETEEVWVTGVIYRKLHEISISDDEKRRLITERNEAELSEDYERVDEINAQLALARKSYLTWKECIDLLKKDINFRSMFLAFAKRGENIDDVRGQNAYALSALFRVMSKRPGGGKNSPENWGLIRTTYPSLEPLKTRDLPPAIEDFNKLAVTKPITSQDWYDYVKIFIDYDIRPTGKVYFEYEPEKKDYNDKNEYWRDIDIESCRSYRTEVSKRRPINAENEKIAFGKNRLSLLLAGVLGKYKVAELTADEKEAIEEVLEQLVKDLAAYGISELGRLTKDIYEGREKVRTEWETSKTDYYMNLMQIAFQLNKEKVWFDESLRIPMDTTFMGHSPYRNAETFEYDIHCKEIDWSGFDIKNKDIDCREWWDNNRQPIAHKWCSRLNRILEYASRDHNTLFIQAEHTAQVARSIIKAKTSMFKKGKLNIMACSTTMEMGVDLGDLELVVMNNVPPHPANYKQRAGRAGRGDQCKSASVTICGSDSIGKSTIANPITGLISRPIQPPKVVLDSSPQIIQRHINSMLFRKFVNENVEGFMTGNDGENDRGFKVGMFFTTYDFPRHSHNLCKGDEIIWPNKYEGLTSAEHHNSHYNKFLAELDNYKNDTEVLTSVKKLIDNTGFDADARVLIEDTKKTMEMIAQMVDDEFVAIKDQWQDDYVENNEPKGYGRRLNYEFTSLYSRNLLTFLSTHQFTPNANMPVGIVELLLEDKDFHSSENPSRDMKVAISEYAPGRRIFIDGTTYLSEGVKWNKAHPNIQIKHCANGHTWTGPQDKCPICDSMPTTWEQFGNSIEMITPTGFYPSKDTSRITTKEPLDLKIGSELIGVGNWNTHDVERLYATRTNIDEATSEILYYNKGFGNGYYVCKDCGYAVAVPTSDGNESEMIYNLFYSNETSKKRRFHECHGMRCYLDTTKNIGENIFKHVVFGGTIQTDYCEIALFESLTVPMPFNEDNKRVATTLGLMLCREFASYCGFDRGEIDFIVRSQLNRTSICIYDTAKGGSGYSKRLDDAALIERLFDKMRKDIRTYSNVHQVLDRQTMQYAEDVDIHKTALWLEREWEFRKPVPDEIQSKFAKVVRVANYPEVEQAVKGIQAGQNCVLFFNGAKIEKWNYDNRDACWRMNRNLNNDQYFQQRKFASYGLKPTISTHAKEMLACASSEWQNFICGYWPTEVYPVLLINNTMYFTNNEDCTLLDENWAARDIYSVEYTDKVNLKGLTYNIQGDEHIRIPSGTKIFTDELFELVYNDSPRLRTFIDNAKGHKLDFFYHEEYMRNHLGMTITMQFIMKLAEKAGSEIGLVFYAGEKYNRPDEYRADDYYGPKEIPKKLKTYCLGSYHRDKYFQEVFLNAMIRDGLISNMSFCKSLEEYVLPHWRMLEVRDTENNASIQILPNGGFENGWRFNVDDATEVYVTKTCDYKKPIPVISGSQPILYDIKVGSDLTWDFLRQQ